MNNMTINKEEFKEQLANNVKSLFRKTVKTASNVELYKALVFTIRSYISDNCLLFIYGVFNGSFLRKCRS